MRSELTRASEARPERTQHRRVFTPRVDIHETPENIVVLADMPGVDDKDVEVTLEKNVLTIEGRTHDDPRPGFRPLMMEVAAGDWRRVFTLSAEVDRERIAASLKDGVLRLTLPKAEPAKARKISVKAG
jgi:HSP20 family protein